MTRGRRIADLMQNATAYRLWQATHAEEKFATVLKHNDLRATRRVLDVGCGPGTNSRYFMHADYLGVDLDAGCIAYARQKYGDKFIVADVCEYTAAADAFDFILVNSFFHHIDDENSRAILESLARAATADGTIHIVDLVLPPKRGVPRFFALQDRGRHARSLDAWRALFLERFEPIVFEPFTLRAAGIPWMELVYFKGRARRGSS